MTHIAFIGAGNMACSIIGGLLAQGTPANSITGTARTSDSLARIQQLGINATSDNIAAAQQADVVVLGVKPQMLKDMCATLQPALAHNPLIVSLAAGVTLPKLSEWLGNHLPIVRCMPNTPSLVQVGASGLYANQQCNDAHKQQVETMMAAVGLTTWLSEEALMNPLTAVSGSGPAYFFLVMEAMIDAGQSMGLSAEAARELTLQTALGAATLASQSDKSPAELRQQVTSPGGTTEQAILSFEHDQLREMFKRAMSAASERGKTLAEQLS